MEKKINSWFFVGKKNAVVSFVNRGCWRDYKASPFAKYY